MSVIELKIIRPDKFNGIYLVEHWGGYEAGGDFTTVGNIFDATIDSKLLDKKNIDKDGKIRCFNFPYLGLEKFKLVKRK